MLSSASMSNPPCVPQGGRERKCVPHARAKRESGRERKCVPHARAKRESGRERKCVPHARARRESGRQPVGTTTQQGPVPTAQAQNGGQWAGGTPDAFASSVGRTQVVLRRRWEAANQA